ncbi:transcription elongation factor GreB [Kangiella sediminilitoris]|uniref:Transcription elongation factor GreB n=1 Tax=Kangiella sediminilitoris TaxID=1144748 RepID=A0A1B3BCZ8_9GAMM|nr:transcription elongation factor GreB [Kangiella sediminilitoris]AOE50638.1 transcription elongation factor GreB [Kangiella sediminilitoris]
MKRSNLITAAGATRLRNELAHLWKNLRPEVTRAINAAAAEGDRSENAEYIYRKKQLREIDRRIRYLQKRTAEMKVIEHRPVDQSKIYFGAVVTLIDERNDETVYRIVGSDEFDYKAEYISVDSPMARALLGKGLDDEVTVKLPEESKQFWISEIEYPDPNQE